MFWKTRCGYSGSVSWRCDNDEEARLRCRVETPFGKCRFKQGETDMGDKGKKDKGKKEQQKKAQLSAKDKRKKKKEKKNK